MKKIALIFLILIILLVLIIILYFVLNNNLLKEQYTPPICGNNICEDDERADYCLDCNLSCKSEFCNSKINIICDNCTETQKKLLPILFEHQIIAYDCLIDYYGYHPPRLIYHTISKTNISDELCSKKGGCYISGGGIAENIGIKQSFIPGLRGYNDTEVTKIENVGFEIHELSHIFTSYGLGIAPAWLTEGIAIYTESRVLCQSKQVLSGKIDDFLSLYQKLIIGNMTLDEIAPYDEYYKTKHNSHIIGAIYFGALEKDYNCDKKCIARILYSLHEYRDNCIGECFENAKKSIPKLMNLSLNNNDLRVPILTNKIIKQKSEEITRENLATLFEILGISYQLSHQLSLP